MKFERIVIAGQELADALSAERLAKIERSELGLNSEQLCKHQEQVSRRGVVEAEIVESIYGYSVRYASGLQDFGLILPARGREDPSLAFAEEYCRKWVAADPERRFATRTVRIDE